MPEPENEYRLLDMHGEFLTTVDELEARRLIKAGYARTFRGRGNGIAKVFGLILKVPLVVVEGGSTNGARSFSINNYTGTRFIFREKISTEAVNFYEFRHKNMDEQESPVAALIRMRVMSIECVKVRVIKTAGDSRPIWSGSKHFRVRSVAARRANTSQSRPHTSVRAA